MAGKSFAADVDAWARKSKLRMEAIFKESLQRVVEDANTPRAQGGNMPVDTGFLRNSLLADINAMPSGPSRREGDGPIKPSDDVGLVFVRATLGDTLYVGWSAVYARRMNIKYGFRDSAAQKWPQVVAEVTAEAKRRIP